MKKGHLYLVVENKKRSCDGDYIRSFEEKISKID